MTKLTIIALIAISLATPALAERQIETPPLSQRATARAAPSPAPAAQPQSQNTREAARDYALLARNPNAFGGLNLSSSLTAIRAASDRNRREWMAKELARTAPARRAAIQASHDAIWAKIAANRVIREGVPEQDNIIHGLMMVFNTAKKAGLY